MCCSLSLADFFRFFFTVFKANHRFCIISKNNSHHLLFFGLLLCLSFPLSAQDSLHIEKPKKKIPLVIEVVYAAGKVTATPPPSTFVNVVELHLGYQTGGEAQWNKIFNYPRLGVSLIYQNLGNNRVLGQQFSIVPMVYFSTARKENAKIFAEIRYGLGLATFNRPYDSITNRTNNLTGSHATWQFTVGANLRWNVSQYVSLQLGGVWYHASDAHTVLPNIGVNTFGGFLSMLVYPYGRMHRTHSLDTLAVEKKWHANFRFGSGWQEKGSGSANGGPKYPVYTGAVYASKRVAKIFLMKAGVIYRYYPMLLSVIEEHKVFNSELNLRSSAFILFIGNEFLLGHFAINLEAGVNVYKPAAVAFNTYVEGSSGFAALSKRYLATRFGAYYYILDPYKHLRNNVFVGASVSANAGQAEFMEFNLGYVF
jgi:hypothetical protein